MNADTLAAAEMHLAAARIALAVWLMLASMHWIAGAGVFGPSGAMPWARMRSRGALGAVRFRMSVRVLRIWMAGQMAIGVALLFADNPAMASTCLLAALLSHGSFIVLSAEQGASGADKMGLIVLAGTMVSTIALARGDGALLLAGCLISGGQLLICYHIAGVSKLLQADWRSGAELQGVMSHSIWGAPWAAAQLRSRARARIVSWALMLGEALFPLALLLPQHWLITALSAMFLFHLATALIMRLSLFPWAFVSAYPAVLLLGRAIRQAIA